MSLPQPPVPAESHSQPDPTVTNGTVTAPAASAAPAVPTHAAVLPRGRRGKRNLGFAIPVVLILVVTGSAGAWYSWFRGPQGLPTLSPHRVEYMDLQLKVVERGTLEAKDNHDVKCGVKPGSRGKPTIKWVVDNGAYVSKGELLVNIDDSYLQEQFTAKKIDRGKALSDKIAAEQLYPQKKSAPDLAKKNLEQWVKGDFPQNLHDLEGKIQKNESAVLQQEDRTAWAGRMVKKGYMTASQAEAEEANLKANKLDLQQIQEQKKVLLEYADPVKRLTLENAIKDAIVAERSAFADMESKQEVFEQQDKLFKDLRTQIEQCSVKAPVSGIVVHAVPETTNRGAGSNQSIIAQGEPVQDGQKMMSIPDLSLMRVRVRIHEAFINHVKPGLRATIRVDALPGEILPGKVVWVAGVASPPDWMSPDVKVYECLVEIEGSLTGKNLKPGLSAVSTIYAEDVKADHVLAIPIQYVVSPPARGEKPRCYVKTAHGAEMREIEIGISDGIFIEVKSGLAKDDEIVLNPHSAVAARERKTSSGDDDKSMLKGDKSGKGKQGGAKNKMGVGRPMD